MNLKRFVSCVIIFMAGAVAGLFLEPTKKQEQIFAEKVKCDTVYIEKLPLIIRDIKPKIIYRKKIDTLVEYSFTARIDTVIQKDTISVTYKFPENAFSEIYYKPQPYPLITKTETIIKERPWYEAPAYLLGGLLTGYLLGSSFK